MYRRKERHKCTPREETQARTRTSIYTPANRGVASLPLGTRQTTHTQRLQHAANTRSRRETTVSGASTNVPAAYQKRQARGAATCTWLGPGEATGDTRRESETHASPRPTRADWSSGAPRGGGEERVLTWASPAALTLHVRHRGETRACLPALSTSPPLRRPPARPPSPWTTNRQRSLFTAPHGVKRRPVHSSAREERPSDDTPMTMSFEFMACSSSATACAGILREGSGKAPARGSAAPRQRKPKCIEWRYGRGMAERYGRDMAERWPRHGRGMAERYGREFAERWARDLAERRPHLVRVREQLLRVLVREGLLEEVPRKCLGSV